MIYVSTGMYKPGNFMKVMRLFDDIEGEFGLSLMSHVNQEEFLNTVEENRDFLRKTPLLIHETLEKMDHSAKAGTAEEIKSGETFARIQELAEELGGTHIIIHSHNREVTNKEKAKEDFKINLSNLRAKSPIPLLLENVGIEGMGTGLFGEEEFIGCIKEQEEMFVLDIGHVQGNNWDLYTIVTELKDYIFAYEISANEEGKDLHERAFANENTGYMMTFLELYKKFTPKAHIILEYNHDFEDREGTLMLDILRLQSILK